MASITGQVNTEVKTACTFIVQCRYPWLLCGMWIPILLQFIGEFAHGVESSFPTMLSVPACPDRMLHSLLFSHRFGLHVHIVMLDVLFVLQVVPQSHSDACHD